MEKYSDVIQTIAQMTNGMIGLWFNLNMLIKIAKGCGHQTITLAKLCVSLPYQKISQFMLWFIPPKQVIMTMIVYYLRDGKWKLNQDTTKW